VDGDGASTTPSLKLYGLSLDLGGASLIFPLPSHTMVVEKKRSSRVTMPMVDPRSGNLEQVFFFARNTWQPSSSS
jgi:hypothetical protein